MGGRVKREGKCVFLPLFQFLVQKKLRMLVIIHLGFVFFVVFFFKRMTCNRDQTVGCQRIRGMGSDEVGGGGMKWEVGVSRWKLFNIDYAQCPTV